jgi:hypothetical protein
MQAIDRPGTFRGTPLDWGVSETKNGYPQFVVRLQALEFYDEEAEQYVPWSEWEQDTTGYFVLYTKDKQGQWQELLNAKQVKKVFGWTGLDFESLATGKYEAVSVLFRVEDTEYNGQHSLKVTWIDTPDANPVKTLPKYDTEKLKGLTAKMSGALTATATTPASAPKKPASAKPAVPPKRGPGRPKANPTPVASLATAPSSKPAVPSVATPPPVTTAAPTTPAPSGPPSEAPETKESAWAAVNSVAGVADDKLAEVWTAVVTTIMQATQKAEDQFGPLEWAKVRKAVIDQTSKF